MIVKFSWNMPKWSRPMCLKAIDMVDRMVWGGTLAKFADRIDVIYGDGLATDPSIMKGLSGCYRPDQRRCILHIKALVAMPDQPSMYAWAVAHDLAHAFDVAHGNLSFNHEKNSLTYLGREYLMRKEANTRIPDQLRSRYRDAKYYDAHQYWEPWEVRPLMAADAVMAELRRDEFPCPNWVDGPPPPMVFMSER